MKQFTLKKLKRKKRSVHFSHLAKNQVIYIRISEECLPGLRAGHLSLYMYASSALMRSRIVTFNTDIDDICRMFVTKHKAVLRVHPCMR